MKPKSGYTLIEMSIVLVIIGLIVGGILTGRDLIDAAAVRAQIAQIDKYNTAVHTFEVKYSYLPGDIPDPYASSFGFQPRGQYAGEGDGNGVLEGNCNNTAANNIGWDSPCGELSVFWQDLSTASLIDASIPVGANYPTIIAAAPNRTLSTSPSIYSWLPAGKIGNTTFVYIYSLFGVDYFSVSTVTLMGWNIQSAANPGLTVQQAYNIDSKIDDGLPQSGNVTACYLNFNTGTAFPIFAAGSQLKGASGGNKCIPTTTATVPLSTDCYGNNNTTGAMTYSIGSNRSVQNCALSFKFQ